eukprot:491603-Amphidinium_carterae.2
MPYESGERLLTWGVEKYLVLAAEAVIRHQDCVAVTVTTTRKARFCPLLIVVINNHPSFNCKQPDGSLECMINEQVRKLK